MFKDGVYLPLIITNSVPESLGLVSNLRFLVPSNYCMATPIKSLFPPINPFSMITMESSSDVVYRQLFMSFNRFLLPLFFDFLFFHYFGQGILILFWLSLFTLIWACAPDIWVSWALSPFLLDFLTAFSSLLILELSFASSVECDFSWDFSWKEIYSGSKKN